MGKPRGADFGELLLELDRGGDSFTGHAAQGRRREHTGCRFVVEREDGFAKGAGMGWDDYADLGHLSAAVWSRFVMDDHHVIQEQHTRTHGATGATGEVFSPRDGLGSQLVRREIERIRAVAAREVGSQEARIFDAHLMLLGDAEVLADVKGRVNSGVGVVTAWVDALAIVEKQWSELPDPYLRARAEDVRAVETQVLAALTGAPALTMTGPGILIAKELTAAQAAGLDRDAVQGIVLAYGSPSSHAAILARSRGVSALVAAGPRVLGLAEGTTIVIDGATGELIIDPLAATLALFRRRAAEQAAQESRHRAAAGEPAFTVDGTRIEVGANLGSLADA